MGCTGGPCTPGKVPATPVVGVTVGGVPCCPPAGGAVICACTLDVVVVLCTVPVAGCCVVAVATVTLALVAVDVGVAVVGVVVAAVPEACDIPIPESLWSMLVLIPSPFGIRYLEFFLF